MTSTSNPHGAPDRILIGAQRQIADASALIEATIRAADWAATQPAIDMEEAAALLFRARAVVLEALRAASFERAHAVQTKVRRRQGIPPRSERTRDQHGRFIK